jgi:hypothetical protein
MPLDFVWEKNDPVNSSITDVNGRPLYEVHTPWKLRNRTTTLSRPDGQVVATVEWHYFTPPTMVYRGQSMSVDDWLTIVSPFAPL